MAAARNFEVYPNNEDAWTYNSHPTNDNVERDGIQPLGSPFIRLTPPVRQGPSEVDAPVLSYAAPHGGFLSNNSSQSGRQMFSRVVADTTWYIVADGNHLVSRHYPEPQEFGVASMQQDRLIQDVPVSRAANFTAAGTDGWYDPVGATNLNRWNEHGSYQRTYSGPTAIAGQDLRNRAHATHIIDPSNLSDTGSTSTLHSAAVCPNAMQDPWSALDAHSGGCDTNLRRGMNHLRLGEEVSSYSTNAYNSASSFTNDTGGATSVSSWPEPVTDQTGTYSFSQSIPTVRPKDVEQDPRWNDLSERIEGLQHQSSTHFRYNVHEGTPSIDNEDDDSVAIPKDAWCDNQDQYLAAHSPSRSLSVVSCSESDTPAKTPTPCPSDVLCCSEPDCDAKFQGNYRKGSFNRHRRLYHQPEGAKLYLCDQLSCERVFKRQDARLKHHRRRHPELGAQEPVLRPRQHESQDQVLRDVSGWTGPMSDENYPH